jgi:hypothetical protein
MIYAPEGVFAVPDAIKPEVAGGEDYIGGWSWGELTGAQFQWGFEVGVGTGAGGNDDDDNVRSIRMIRPISSRELSRRMNRS